MNILNLRFTRCDLRGRERARAWPSVECRGRKSLTTDGHGWTRIKSEGRNPRPERNPKSEIRSPNARCQRLGNSHGQSRMDTDKKAKTFDANFAKPVTGTKCYFKTYGYDEDRFPRRRDAFPSGEPEHRRGLTVHRFFGLGDDWFWRGQNSTGAGLASKRAATGRLASEWGQTHENVF